MHLETFLFFFIFLLVPVLITEWNEENRGSGQSLIYVVQIVTLMPKPAGYLVFLQVSKTTLCSILFWTVIFNFCSSSELVTLNFAVWSLLCTYNLLQRIWAVKPFKLDDGFCHMLWLQDCSGETRRPKAPRDKMAWSFPAQRHKHCMCLSPTPSFGASPSCHSKELWACHSFFSGVFILKLQNLACSQFKRW